MADGRGGKRDRESAAAWNAWLDEIIRTGRVVMDITSDDPGAIIIAPCHDPRSTGRSPVPEDDPVTSPTPTGTEGDAAGCVIVDRTDEVIEKGLADIVTGQHLRGRGEHEPDERTSGGTRPSRTPEERRMLDGLARTLGRTLTVEEENLALERRCRSATCSRRNDQKPGRSAR